MLTTVRHSYCLVIAQQLPSLATLCAVSCCARWTNCSMSASAAEAAIAASSTAAASAHPGETLSASQLPNGTPPVLTPSLCQDVTAAAAAAASANDPATTTSRYPELHTWTFFGKDEDDEEMVDAPPPAAAPLEPSAPAAHLQGNSPTVAAAAPPVQPPSAMDDGAEEEEKEEEKVDDQTALPLSHLPSECREAARELLRCSSPGLLEAIAAMKEHAAEERACLAASPAADTSPLSTPPHKKQRVSSTAAASLSPMDGEGEVQRTTLLQHRMRPESS